MTLKNYCLAFILLTSLTASAQYDSSQRNFSHYIGVQANQLFKQILNLSNSSPAIGNPYLVNYNFNHTNGWGFNFGLGFTFNELEDNDEQSKSENKQNDLFLRIGFERKSYLGKRWLTSFGFDVVLDHTKNKTVTTFNDFQGSTTNELTTKSTAIGTGPRFTLTYKIAEKIFLGTEATYYFKSGEESEEIKINGNILNDDDSPAEFKKFQFHAPVVLLLIVKF